MQAQPRQAPAADGWNEWLQRHLESFAEVIGEEAGKEYRQLQKQIDELRAEIKKLNANA